jgi:hypothetical protein
MSEHVAGQRSPTGRTLARIAATDRRFVCIGDRQELWDAEEDPRMPPGTESTPGVLTRLALGLRRGGSLVGLLGWSVQT